MATATATPIRAFVSGETVTPEKLNELSTPTISVALEAGDVTTSVLADGAVTQAKMNAAVTFIPAGAVMAFAMNSNPSGWLQADGNAISRTTYAALYAAIGTTYGAGDGSTTFNLPDLRGYFVRGSGTNSDGAAAGTFGAKQGDTFQNHTHPYSYRDITMGPTSNAYEPSATYPYWFTTTNAVTSASGNAQAGTETRPKNIALRYCIKY